jgi:hypothetical protein
VSIPDTSIQPVVKTADRTRVRLEHRGWERLADPAGQRTGYDAGWDVVLGRYLGSFG